MQKQLPSPELLRKLLRYDPATGEFWWRKRTAEMCGTDREAARWNARHNGTRAFASPSSHGYSRNPIMGMTHSAHRCAWAIHYGKWPEIIDHINGDRFDNRIENLREVTTTENNRNARKRLDNSSGQTGVSFVPSRGNWIAHISVDGKQMTIGRFRTKKLAVEARKIKEMENGYHKNHGA